MHRDYALSPTCTLSVTRGDLTAMATDAITAPADAPLAEVTPGVCAPIGEARITFARGPLRARYVIHVVAPSWDDNAFAARLGAAYDQAFALARRFGLRSVAFATLGCDTPEGPLAEAVAAAIAACARAAEDFDRVWFCAPSDGAWSAWLVETGRAALRVLPSSPAVVRCLSCGFRLAGFRCRGSRAATHQVRYRLDGDVFRRASETADVALPVQVRGCGAMLVWDPRTRALTCPEGCGALRVSCAASHGLMAIDDAGSTTSHRRAVADAHAALGEPPNDSPMMTCTRCGFTVDGALCDADAHGDRPRRLACDVTHDRTAHEYAWSCEEGCAREAGGGLLRRDCLRCLCDESPMAPLDFEERHGPPLG